MCVYKLTALYINNRPSYAKVWEIERDRDEISKMKEEVRTDVTRCKIGRTAYAKAASGSTGMR